MFPTVWLFTFLSFYFYLSRRGLQTGSPAPLGVTSPSPPSAPTNGEDEEDQTAAVTHSGEGWVRGRGQDTE